MPTHPIFSRGTSRRQEQAKVLASCWFNSDHLNEKSYHLELVWIIQVQILALKIAGIFFGFLDELNFLKTVKPYKDSLNSI